MFHRPKVSRSILAIMCAMSFIMYLDRVNLSAAAGLIRDDLHLTNTDVGLVFAAFAYTYAICQVIGGWLSDRFGAKTTLIDLRVDLDRGDGRHGSCGRHRVAVLRADAARRRRRRGAAGAGARADQLVAREEARLRAGPHAFVLATRQRDHAAADRDAGGVRVVARIVLPPGRADGGLGRASTRGISPTIRASIAT